MELFCESDGPKRDSGDDVGEQLILAPGNFVAQAQFAFLESTSQGTARAQFDYLKSLEIEEKINAIRWCRGTAAWPIARRQFADTLNRDVAWCLIWILT